MTIIYLEWALLHLRPFFSDPATGVICSKNAGWTHEAGAERQPITEVCGEAPSGNIGQSAWSEGKRASPLELRNFSLLETNDSSKFGSFKF